MDLSDHLDDPQPIQVSPLVALSGAAKRNLHFPATNYRDIQETKDPRPKTFLTKNWRCKSALISWSTSEKIGLQSAVGD